VYVHLYERLNVQMAWLLNQSYCAFSFRYESAAASFKVCLQSYLSSDLPAADNSRESSPLHMSSTKTAKVLLLHKSQESSSRDANVVSYIVRQASFLVHPQQYYFDIQMVFRKEQPLLFSCITLRKSNQFE